MDLIDKLRLLIAFSSLLWASISLFLKIDKDDGVDGNGGYLVIPYFNYFDQNNDIIMKDNDNKQRDNVVLSSISLLIFSIFSIFFVWYETKSTNYQIIPDMETGNKHQHHHSLLNTILGMGFHKEESLANKLLSIITLSICSISMNDVIKKRNDKENGNDDDTAFVIGIINLTLSCCLTFLTVCFNRERDFTDLDKLSSNNSSSIPILANTSGIGASTPLLSVSDPMSSSASSETKKKIKISAELNAGLLSRLLFSWVDSLIFTGFSRPLEKSDFPYIRDDDDVALLDQKFEKCWHQVKKEEEARVKALGNSSLIDGTKLVENGKIKDDGERPYLIIKALHRSGILTPFYNAAFLKLLYDTSMFVSPQLLRKMIHYLLDEDASKSEGYNIALIMFLNALFSTLILHQYFHLVFRAGMRVRSALVTALYRKSLKLSLTSRSNNDLGATITYMSNDAQQLQDIFPYLHVVWSSPLQIFYSMFFLWREIQYSSLFCIGVIFLFVTPLTVLITTRTRSIQAEVMALRSKRVSLTGEVLSVMKTLKMYSWDFVFRDRILEAREIELNRFKDYIYFSSIGRMLWFGTPALVTLSALAGYVALGGDLDPETAWTTISLLGLLRFPLAQLPNIFQGAISASVSMRRIEKFLLCPELQSETTNEIAINLDETPSKKSQIPRVISRESLMSPYPTAVIGDNNTEFEDASTLQAHTIHDDPQLSERHHLVSHPTKGGFVIEIANGNFFWDDDRKIPAIKDIEMRVSEGSLVAVIGEVGSGKSALIYSLIGDLQPSIESPPYVSVNGSVAYAAQVPWIQNASVRNNILFGSTYDEAWYRRVVYACALEPDFEQLPTGDLTEIGERGINLSGGQKARISLARAIYSRSDIILLENCFEAVDEHVGTHIWNNCFQGIVKTDFSLSGRPRTVILVTHSLKHLDKTDSIILMKKGSIHLKGPYSLLMSAPEFSALLSDAQKKRDRTKSDTNESDSNDKKEEVSSSDKANTTTAAATATATQSEETNKSTSTKKSNEPKKGDLIATEDRAVGQVKFEVYSLYLDRMGGVPVGLICMLMLLLKTTTDLATSRWLAYWSSQTGKDDEPSLSSKEAIVFSSMGFPGIRPVESLDPWIKSEIIEGSHNTHSTGYYLGIYTGLSFSLILLTSFGSLLFSLYALRASKSSHYDLISAIIRSPTSFFDTTPVGRILNRCSKDIQAIDDALPQSIFVFLALVVDIAGLMVMISIVLPYFLFVLPVLFICYMFVQRLYISSSRELKRMESILRSPIFSNFGETLDGATSIRAYRCQDRFIYKNQDLLDDNLRAYYGTISSNRWLAVRLETISNFLILATAMFIVEDGNVNASLAGLILSYVLNVAQSLNWTVRMMSDVETNIVSIERVDEYSKLLPEAPENMPNEPPQNWPEKGTIVIKDLRARYREGLDEVLKGISLTIQPGEKIGIAGRTGSGKSTFLLLLLRIIEPSGGFIEIDGINTKNVGLKRLRSSIAIIPQDPILFAGTLRFNLDPLNQHNDAQIWNALQIAHLEGHVRSLEKGLDSLIIEGGSNFSFGQRQLLTVARALIRNSKILLLDEATSGIDYETDQAVQKTLRRDEFKFCTTLTIAHRLETILDSDRVAFMDSGKIIELDSPNKLLQNRNGGFYSLVSSMKKSDVATSDASKSTTF